MSRSPSLLTLAAATAAAAVVVFLDGFWAGSHGEQKSARRRVGSADACVVRPVWDYYDRNPPVTPEFDFAALYDGERLAKMVPFR